MKKTLILLAALFASLAGFSQAPLRQETPATGIPDPLNVAHGLSQSQLLQIAKENRGRTAARPVRQPNPAMKADATVDTTSYFAAAQSYYYDGYDFRADGGDVKTYQVGVAVNGNQVTFKNFFNLYDPEAYKPSEEYTFTGTYDAQTKTITVPTNPKFDKATIVAKFVNHYYGTLVSGTVDEDGNLTRDENLVLHVDGNFDRIYTTDQAVGISMWEPGIENLTEYGVSSATALLKGISISLPKDDGNLIVFNKNLSFGETTTTLPVTRTMTIVNTGKQASDYTMEIESDPEGAFTADAYSGTVEGEGTKDITFTLSTTTPGDAEGLASIKTKSANEPFNIQLTGTILPPPDFSDIVLRGNFGFTTSLTSPFYKDELDGHKVVRSAQLQWDQSSMDVTFTVPEGKLGKVSWKGIYKSSTSLYSGSLFVDDFDTPYKTYGKKDKDASEMIEFAPGTHTIRFLFDCSFYVTDKETMANSLYAIWDLALDTEDLKADAAVLKDGLANVGFSILGEDGKATVTDNIVLTNKGGNDLSLISVTSDNPEFSSTTQVDPVSTMKDLVIPITLSTTTAGDKAANLTIKTSAGTFTAKAKGTVIAQQDFSKVVTEGYEHMTVENDPAFPYIVDGDSAYNANAGYDDDMAGTSQVTFRFTIPEGKRGILSWDGYTYDQSNEGQDYGQLILTHPDKEFKEANRKTGAAGSNDFSDSTDLNFLNCTPGDHSVTFQYLRNGDGEKAGKSMFSFKNLKLHIVDFDAHAAELLNDQVDFKPCYVGPNRYSLATVTLRNLGSEPLSADSVINAGPFYGAYASGIAPFGNDLKVTLAFYPQEKDEYCDSVTIRTNAGDFKVLCTGKTLDDTGIIYNGDLEDQYYDWNAYDADGDYNTWVPADALFYFYQPNGQSNDSSNGDDQTEEDYSRYCHSGSCLFGSPSISVYGDALTPDNWVVSPAITIPEEGGVLSYYVASLDPKRCAENYTVYVSETDDYTLIEDEGDVLYDGLYELPEQYDLIPWSHYEYNLDKYKGKTIHISFRHHDCSNQYVLMIDDISVYQHGYEPTSVAGVKANDGASQVKDIYSLGGQKLDKLQRGINVVRMSDGSTHKIVIK